MKKHWTANFKRAPKAHRTDRDGTVFDSKGELSRWRNLQLWQLAGEIRALRRQVAFPLILPNGTPILTPTGKTCLYTADFVYERVVYRPSEEQGARIVSHIEVIEDFKGYTSSESKLRIAVFEAIYGKKVSIVRSP